MSVLRLFAPFASLTILEIAPTENDGEKLSSLLGHQHTPEQIRDCMGGVEGP